MSEKVNFQFYNSISPRYIEPIFLKLEFDEWYSIVQLVNLLRQDIQIDGKDTVERNVDAWSNIGLGKTKLVKDGRIKRTYFQITSLGKYLQEIYSTNSDLFFDLMHYFFYSTWYRTKSIQKAKFWVYAQVCNDLWLSSPSEMDSFKLTSKIQGEALDKFAGSYPAISERSIGAAFPWVTKLSPAFLQKLGAKSDLSSKRRDFCTPQLFHLAVDLSYSNRQLSYGTSLNVDDELIKEISITCLLDPDRFWEMTERTQMMIKGFDIRKSQWGPTITLNQAPNWIELPKFEHKGFEAIEEEDE